MKLTCNTDNCNGSVEFKIEFTATELNVLGVSRTQLDKETNTKLVESLLSMIKESK